MSQQSVRQIDATSGGDRVGLSGVNADITSKLTSFLSARSVRPAVLALLKRRTAAEEAATPRRARVLR